ADFGKREPTEKLQVDQLSKLRLDFRQLIEGIADRRELFGVYRILNNIGSERRNFEFTTAFDGASAARVINDESAHGARGIPHEAGPVGKGAAVAGGDVEISLVQKRGDT